MKVLIIGYGSIGIRHAKILKELGCNVSVLSSRRVQHTKRYSSLEDALGKENPEYIIVANKTCDHYDILVKLAQLKYKEIVLVEKPLFDKIKNISTEAFKDTFVGYDMRFDPIIRELKNILKSEKIISVQAYVGQYLPQWRPERDYRTSYSAKKVEGGGVIRDLSHELDYILMLFGKWEKITAVGGHLSSLEIDSDDIFSMLLSTSKCPAIYVQMNYIDRVSNRNIRINTDKHFIYADFLDRKLIIDNEVFNFAIDNNYTYRKQHEAILKNNDFKPCSFEEGREVLKLIHAAEISAYSKEPMWVKND